MKKDKFKIRCSQLDQNGRQCRNQGEFGCKYHGDSEIYNYPRWVRVVFCAKHTKQMLA